VLPGYLKIINMNTSSTTVKHLSSQTIKEILLPYPPINEQKRIVAKIDEIFEQVAKVKESLEKSKKLVKQFRKMVLTKAFKGELVPTEAELARREGRDYETASQLLAKIKPNKEKPNTKTTTPPINNEPPTDLPEGWIEIEAGQIFKWTSGKFIDGGSNEIGKYPVYGGNGISGYYDNWLIEKKTFVIGRVGALCGNIYITNDKSWVTDNAIYAKEILLTCIDIVYAYWIFTMNNLNKSSGGSGQPFVNQKILNAVVLLLPPLNEQKRIVAKIDELYKYADEIEAQIDFALKRTDTIKQAVLAKAFRGELVITEAELARREGRDYEPASALLEKIKSQAKEISEKPQIRKRTNKKGE